MAKIDVVARKRKDDCNSKHSDTGAYCAARISMILYYADPDAVDEIAATILEHAEYLVSKHVDKRKYKDFIAKKNPFID